MSKSQTRPRTEAAPTTRSRTLELLHQLRFAAGWLLKSMCVTPVSVMLIVILWTLRFAFGHNPDRLWNSLGLTLPYQFTDWHLLTSGLTTGSHLGASFSTVAILLLAVPAEAVLGSRRFLITAAAMHIVTAPLTMLAASALNSTFLSFWGQELRLSTLLSPAGWIVGSLAAASAFMPVLWRRRTRIMLVAMFVTMLLYTGTLSDIAAVIAVAIGLPVGNFWCTRRIGPPQRRAMSLRESRILVACGLFFVAVGPVIAGINPNSQGIFAETTYWIWQPAVTADQISYFCTADPTSQECLTAQQASVQSGFGPLIANLMPLLLTAVAGLGLVRGRRLAWWLALLLQFAAIVVVLGQIDFAHPGTDSAALVIILVAQLILPWLLAIALLLVTRRFFLVHIDTRKVGVTALVIAVMLLATAALWFFGAIALHDSFQPHATNDLILSELPNRYLPPVVSLGAMHYLFPSSSAAWFLYEWTGNIFWLTVAAMLYRLLMSVASPATRADQVRARALLQSGSGDHLSWMTLWRGNRYWFAPRDSGAVAFRVHNGIAVTVGEPIVGPDGNRSTIADQFEQFAVSQGWQTAWYSVREDFADDRASRGFMNVHVAEESIVLCDDHSVAFTGKKFQNIRTARNRAGKENISALWTSWHDLSGHLRERIIQLSEDWVADKALPEMGFTLGSVAEMQDADTMLLLAVDDQDRIHGITSWIPVYEHGRLAGYTLDVMRRDATGFRPVIEFLLAEAAIKGNELGLDFMSLSGAPLAPSQSKELDGMLAVTLDKVGETMEPLYGFRSLAASKYKFHPEHHGWYLAYDNGLALPAIGIAVSTCYLPHLKTRDAVTALRIWMQAQRAETETG